MTSLILPDVAQASLVEIQRVTEMEELVRKMPPVEIRYRHYFANGLYAREMLVQADAFVTGKIHKHENFNVLLKGEMTVLTHEGPKRVIAPFPIVSPAGTKRIARTHTDCAWLTIHPNPTNEHDLEKLEAMFVAQDLEEYRAFCVSQIEERDLWKTLT